MAIALGSTSVSANVTATSVTWSHTVASDDNIIVVCVQTTDTVLGDRTVSTVTFNGDALTSANIAKDDLAQELRTEIWYRVNPDVVTGDVIVTMGGKCNDIQACAISLKGVDTLDPIDKTASAGAISTNPTITYTHDHDNSWMIATMMNDLGDITSIVPIYNEIHTTDLGGSSSGSQYRTTAGAAGEYTINWTADEESWIISAVSIKAAPLAVDATSK